MAYGVRYRAEYENNGRDIKIEILKNDYTGAIFDVEGVTNQLSLKYKSKESPINGSEFRFTLMTKYNSQYTELLSAEIGDYIGKYYIDNVLQHTGELDVENIETQYFDYVYEYDLSFNDRLAKLDKFTIQDPNGDEINGENSLLWYLKQALVPTNLELDFAVILNTKEDDLLTLDNDNPLSECDINAERFKRVKDGKKSSYNCKEVIESILNPFSLKLYQAENKFFIVNPLEIDSFQYNYLYSDLSLDSRVSVSNTIDISNFNFDKSNRLTKISALKRADVIFQNKTIQANLVRNPNFDDANLYWFKDEPGINVSIQSNELAISSNAMGKYFYSEDFAIEKVTDNDLIRLEFEAYLVDITYDNAFGNRDPELEVSLVYENATKESYITRLSTGTIFFSGVFSNKGTGDYKIEIKDVSHPTSPYTFINYRMDNFSLTAVSDSEVFAYDRFFTVTNTDNNAIDVDDENTILIADGIQVNDVGNLKVGGTVTKEWSTFTGAESQPLIYLYLLNKLRSRQTPNNDLKIIIIDDGNTSINYNTSILFDSKRYIIKEYNYRYSTTKNYIQLELIEVNFSSFNYTIENTTLSSIDGESTSNTSNSFTETDPTVPTFVKNITQTNITEWNNKVDRWENWLENLTVKKDILIENTTSSTVNGKINNTGIFEGKNFVFNGVDGSGGVGSGGSAAAWGNITGTLADQTDLQLALNGKANSSHTHSADDITSGTFSDARISSSSVTQHLGNYVDRSTNQSINGDKTFIADTTFNSRIDFGDSSVYITRSSNNLLFRAEDTIDFLSAAAASISLISQLSTNSTFSEFLLASAGNNFRIRNYADNANSNDNRTDFYSSAGGSFFTFSPSTTEALRIQTNGNVGINTSTADERLHVLGNIKLSGAIVSDQSQLSFLNNGSALPINTNNLLVSNSYSDRSEVPTNGIYVKGDIRTESKLIFSSSLSSNNQITDFQQGYSLWSDNAGDGNNGSNTRLWFNAPNKGSFVFGSRSGSSFLDSIRMRSRMITIESNEASNIVIDSGVISATNFVFG